jgi:hypothetical protein
LTATGSTVGPGRPDVDGIDKAAEVADLLAVELVGDTGAG